MTKAEGKPPYLPFSSFLTALDQLAQAIPTEIQKNVFPYHSGVLQGQLIGALRFLDLIDTSGAPKGDKLERLATEKALPNRRSNLRPILKSAYSEVLKIDLAKMTRPQLDAAFERYGITGDTKKKAKTFFIKAAVFAELPVSPFLTRRINPPKRQKRRGGQDQSIDLDKRQIKQDQTLNEQVTAKTLELKGGAILTILVKGNLFDLDNKDRELVFAIMDQIRSHQ
jgi:hypothetical protein